MSQESNQALNLVYKRLMVDSAGADGQPPDNFPF